MRFTAQARRSAIESAIQQLRDGRLGEAGYGRRVALVLTIPTFHDPVARDVRRAATGELYVVRTVWNRALDLATARLTREARTGLGRNLLVGALPMPMTFPSLSIHSTRVPVDAQALDAIFESVTSATVTCRPQHAEPPLDATIFEVTFGGELDETRYRWSGATPAGWEPLAEFAQRLIQLVDEPAGVPTR
jgi:hypothetical protein